MQSDRVANDDAATRVHRATGASCRSDLGQLQGCVLGGTYGLFVPGPALCSANTAEISGIYYCCGADIGAGDWRERRDFQRGVRRFAEAAAVRASRATGTHLRRFGWAEQ